MRILILDTYYPAFLKSFYMNNIELKKASYQVQKKALFNEMFGTSDFYSHTLNKLGHESKELIINNQYLQASWIKESKGNVETIISNSLDFLISRMGFLKGRAVTLQEMKILNEQVERFKPDVIYNQSRNA